MYETVVNNYIRSEITLEELPITKDKSVESQHALPLAG